MRPIVTGSGLRGPGQEIWSEGMKREIRDRVFKKGFAAVMRQEGEDEAGSESSNWPVVAIYDGRLDNVRSTGGDAKIYGEEISEGTSHILSLQPGADLKSSDRVLAEGQIWIINSIFVRTDEATTRAQVKELHV